MQVSSLETLCQEIRDQYTMPTIFELAHDLETIYSHSDVNVNDVEWQMPIVYLMSELESAIFYAHTEDYTPNVSQGNRIKLESMRKSLCDKWKDFLQKKMKEKSVDCRKSEISLSESSMNDLIKCFCDVLEEACKYLPRYQASYRPKRERCRSVHGQRRIRPCLYLGEKAKRIIDTYNAVSALQVDLYARDAICWHLTRSLLALSAFHATNYNPNLLFRDQDESLKTQVHTSTQALTGLGAEDATQSYRYVNMAQRYCHYAGVLPFMEEKRLDPFIHSIHLFHTRFPGYRGIAYYAQETGKKKYIDHRSIVQKVVTYYSTIDSLALEMYQRTHRMLAYTGITPMYGAFLMTPHGAPLLSILDRYALDRYAYRSLIDSWSGFTYGLNSHRGTQTLPFKTHPIALGYVVSFLSDRVLPQCHQAGRSTALVPKQVAAVVIGGSFEDDLAHWWKTSKQPRCDEGTFEPLMIQTYQSMLKLAFYSSRKSLRTCLRFAKKTLSPQGQKDCLPYISDVVRQIKPYSPVRKQYLIYTLKKTQSWHLVTWLSQVRCIIEDMLREKDKSFFDPDIVVDSWRMIFSYPIPFKKHKSRLPFQERNSLLNHEGSSPMNNETLIQWVDLYKESLAYCKETGYDFPFSALRKKEQTIRAVLTQDADKKVASYVDEQQLQYDDSCQPICKTSDLYYYFRLIQSFATQDTVAFKVLPDPMSDYAFHSDEEDIDQKRDERATSTKSGLMIDHTAFQKVLKETPSHWLEPMKQLLSATMSKHGKMFNDVSIKRFMWDLYQDDQWTVLRRLWGLFQTNDDWRGLLKDFVREARYWPRLGETLPCSSHSKPVTFDLWWLWQKSAELSWETVQESIQTQYMALSHAVWQHPESVIPVFKNAQVFKAWRRRCKIEKLGFSVVYNQNIDRDIVYICCEKYFFWPIMQWVTSTKSQRLFPSYPLLTTIALKNVNGQFFKKGYDNKFQKWITGDYGLPSIEKLKAYFDAKRYKQTGNKNVAEVLLKEMLIFLHWAKYPQSLLMLLFRDYQQLIKCISKSRDSEKFLLRPYRKQLCLLCREIASSRDKRLVRWLEPWMHTATKLVSMHIAPKLKKVLKLDKRKYHAATKLKKIEMIKHYTANKLEILQSQRANVEVDPEDHAFGISKEEMQFLLNQVLALPTSSRWVNLVGWIQDVQCHFPNIVGSIKDEKCNFPSIVGSIKDEKFNFPRIRVRTRYAFRIPSKYLKQPDCYRKALKALVKGFQGTPAQTEAFQTALVAEIQAHVTSKQIAQVQAAQWIQTLSLASTDSSHKDLGAYRPSRC